MIIEGWRLDFNWRVIMNHYAIRYFLSPVLQGTSILLVLIVYSVGIKDLKFSGTLKLGARF